MKLLLTLTVFFSISAHAAPAFDLKISFKENGKIISKNRLIIQPEKEGKIVKSDQNEKTKTELTVTATEGKVKKNKGILLKVDHKYWSNGKVAHHQPEVLVFEGIEASFETSSNNNNDKTVITVTATRVEI